MIYKAKYDWHELNILYNCSSFEELAIQCDLFGFDLKDVMTRIPFVLNFKK